jgi:type I restriction enzyme S subunit
MKTYDSYKESGIQWIGEIPEHWVTKKFKLVTTLLTCGHAATPNYVDETDGIPFLSAQNIKNERISLHEFRHIEKSLHYLLSKNHKVEKGDLLQVRVGGTSTIGQTAIVELDFEFSVYVSLSHIKLDKSQVYNSYIKFMCNSDRFKECCSVEMKKGAGVANLNVADLEVVRIPVPPLSEQTAIANYLDTQTTEIDQVGADKEALINLYELEKKALINEAVTKGVTLSGVETCSPKLKPSGIDWLGDVPEHWEVKKLKYLVEGKLMYGANEVAEFDNVDFPRYIRITDFGDDGTLRNETFKSLPYNIAKDYFLTEGDVLFARSGATVGKTFQFKAYNGLACFAGYLIKATPNKSIILSDWLYYFTKSDLYENWKNSIFNQSTIQNIGADKYNSLPVPICTLEEQTAIVRHIETETTKINDKINQIKQEIELLKEYRQALIFEAVTGKIRVH